MRTIRAAASLMPSIVAVLVVLAIDATEDSRHPSGGFEMRVADASLLLETPGSGNGPSMIDPDHRRPSDVSQTNSPTIVGTVSQPDTYDPIVFRHANGSWHATTGPTGASQAAIKVVGSEWDEDE